MIENLLYVIVGFVVTYLSLEVVWHYTAARIKEDRKMIKPCLFKEIKTILVATMPQTRSTQVSVDNKKG